MITRLLSRLQLWQKIGWLVLAMAIPAALVGFFYLRLASAQVNQTRDELDGARYLQALSAVQGEILTHRSSAFAFLSGDTARRGEVVAQQEEADKQIVTMDRVDAGIGRQLEVTDAWQSVKSEWSALKSKTLTQPVADNDAAHAALIAHFQQLTDLVSARSKTSTDPQDETHNLIRLSSEYTPNALLYAGNMRRYAVKAAAKGYLGGDDRMGIQIYRDRFHAELDKARAALEQLPQDVRADLHPAFDAVITTSTDYDTALQTKLLAAANLTATGAEIYDGGVATNREIKKLSIACYEATVKALQQRLSATTVHRDVTTSIGFVAVAFGLALAWLVSRALSKPLTQAVSVFSKISGGRYDSQIETAATDEAGQVLRALDEMQGKLRTQIETERALAAENTRIRQALDKASTSVVLADEQHQIIYLNDIAQASFTRNAQQIRTTLPAFDATRLRGSSLEALSPDPASQRRLLDNLTGVDVQERVLGEFTYRTVTNPVIDDKGERLGTVMEWSQRTQEVRVERELQHMLAAINSGSLGKRIDLAGKTGFFEAMSRSVNQLADNITAMVSSVKAAAGEIHRGAQEISAGNSNLSLRTEEQAASLEETASSMEEMTTTVKQNADNAGQANQLALAARDQAEQGGMVVGKAVQAMSGINDSAKKIADIIGVIDEIAFQTNLLALNAAVEAARAGEQGRGFAVVATEVRNLAGRSATAAKEIKGLIQDSVKKVSDGSVLVTQSGQTLEQIVTSVKKVSDIVAEIAAASREQSLGIEQVGRAVMQMDELTQQNAALVEQATAASQSMAVEAGGLNEMMAHYDSGGIVHGAPAAGGDSSSLPAGDGSMSGKQPAATPTRAAAPPSERRSGTRPWTKPAGKTPQTAVSRPEAAVASASRPPVLADAGTDTEWQEF
ncbi:MAG: methyl-accepting chemotaxis sensory transducer [Gammaproteobacteria bacterium]|nr:methyl-accepting chemotaxis sensory transducer [Gammaproteobacteria bacterium]